MHDGHRDRLRERFAKEGLDSFDDHQILELLLFYSVPRIDTNPLAHRLCKEYKSLSDVFDAGIENLIKVPGISLKSAILISMIPQLSRRYRASRAGVKSLLNSSEKAGQYAINLFDGRIYEAFFVICLDSQNRVNKDILINEGTLNEAPAYPRLIVEAALKHKADGVILVHNHPGGSKKPSAADIDATKKIRAALEPISIKVRDHIIVTADGYVSFADEGLI